MTRVPYMLPLQIELVEYIDETGFNPFGTWFRDLDSGAAARIRIALSRLARGAHSNLKGVGDGVLEYRIDTGPGHRVYLAKRGSDFILLLGGGSKRRQAEDISAAKRRWATFKSRQKEK